MNLFCIVGQIEQLPSLKETVNGIKTCNVLVKVQRSFANPDGEYEFDHIQVEVWRGLAETLSSVGKLDDLIAVKGRIASRKVIKEDRTFYNYAFVAEKIDFLESRLSKN